MESFELTDKVIQFNEMLRLVEDYATIPFDPGMKGKIAKAKSFSNNIFELTIDFFGWKEKNLKYEKRDWPEEKTWSETEFYPSLCISTVYVYKSKLPFLICE